ncbi:hypothetical protein KSP35_12260 [Aquihabitans sp. G128]|uniref:SAM-dependent methyltransferase n=1 Tax=Aquihabitans sp. G128 TaxID=2849779 RepID=UPI001C212CEF|nr:SAM-dependent methyltransferase [Aquihabitans sp. G128]QXC59184.1 hypothetical protein KSP35_12260 [Aquihabitans sp. G128]
MSDAPVVLLAGAGPGDPELLTLDAYAALAAASAILADRSLEPLLGALTAERALGPTTAIGFTDDDLPAAEALLELASSAAATTGVVVRLYRGDPWGHPAGDDERAALQAAGVACQVLPGVLAELAAAGAVGIPLQVRDRSVATTFAVDTAAVPTVASPPHDPAHGLVVRTDDLARTAARLAAPTADGTVAADRPVALVPAGPGAAALRTTLGALAAQPLLGGGPGLVVVGSVAELDLAARPTPLEGASR